MMYHKIVGQRIFFITISFVLLCIIFSGCSIPDVNYTPPPGSNETAITHYSFGKITVDGKAFVRDIAILPDKSVQHWDVKTHHRVQSVDIKNIVDDTTKTFIIGTGADEGCAVLDETVDYIKSKGIELHILNTYKAVRLFNKLPKKGLSACFHINC